MSNLTNKKIPSGLDPWNTLRAHTDARIGLGRVGDGLPTERLLEFQMAHARARDSVHMAFDRQNVICDQRRNAGLCATQTLRL